MRLTPEAALDKALEFLISDQNRKQIGVAVSGGSDSLAVLILAQEWAVRAGGTVKAATVDHGLRAEAADEITHVRKVCRDLGISHDVLTWNGWDGTGNLQAQARRARLDLLANWGACENLACVLLGHTADDQAETVLMHLARGSGVDGLAGIHTARDCFVRPVLDIGRDELRDVLREREVSWMEDPSNDDPQFDRVKTRQMMVHLGELGLTRDRLVQTAKHMQTAQSSLTKAAVDFARSHVSAQAGDLLIPKSVFHGIGGDTQARVVASALMWIGRNTFRPRYAALVEMADAVSRGQTRTLHGVLMSAEGETVRLTREFNALDPGGTVKAAELTEKDDSLWDGRWSVVQSTPVSADHLGRRALDLLPQLSIHALGEALKDVPDWRQTGLPRASLMSTPAVFSGDSLIAAPVAGLKNGFEARIVADFSTFLLSR